MPVAIITGASRGLGRALAQELAGRGWDLVLDGRDAGTLRAAVDELTHPPKPPISGVSPTDAYIGDRSAPVRGRVRGVPGDVTSAAHRAALVAAAEELAGAAGLDLLVNNASALGAQPLVPLAEMAVEGLREALETNVTAPFALVKAALPALRAAGGAVLNVSSDAAVEAYPTWGGYGASKAALDHLSAVLAAEEPDVRVWWVDPGDLRTDLYAAAVPDDPDFADRLAPSEVAPAVLRLLDGGAAGGGTAGVAGASAPEGAGPRNARASSGRYVAGDLAADAPAAAPSAPVGGTTAPLEAR